MTSQPHEGWLYLGITSNKKHQYRNPLQNQRSAALRKAGRVFRPSRENTINSYVGKSVLQGNTKIWDKQT